MTKQTLEDAIPQTTTSGHRHTWEYPFVRELAREAGLTRQVSDDDAQAVIDWLLADADPEYRPLPDDWTSPEFLAEAKRRNECQSRELNAKSVREQLLRRWGELDG